MVDTSEFDYWQRATEQDQQFADLINRRLREPVKRDATVVRTGHIVIKELFTDLLLSDWLKYSGYAAHRQLEKWPSDGVLATPETDIIDQLMASALVECPVLRREQAYLLEFTEYNVDLMFGHRGKLGVKSLGVMNFALAVPFTGDIDVFDKEATNHPADPPRATFRSGPQRELVLFSAGRRDPHLIKADFDGQLEQIEQCLAWSRNDIDAYMHTIQAEIYEAAAERRAGILADRHTYANIGFPIKLRPDADTQAEPDRRHQVTPTHEPPRTKVSTPFQLEPTLVERDYEAVLAVLRNMRNGFERSPSTTARLGEEAIRDLLLIGLNARFEGNAAGEVFNGAGKTDILIRVDDRNIFIGECKIWNGSKTVSDALDQLLRYLVWRDTKAALLLFIREGDVSTVTTKAVAKIEEYRTYKRRGKTFTEERYDFVLHAVGDQSREIHLALLPFLIAGTKSPTGPA